MPPRRTKDKTKARRKKRQSRTQVTSSSESSSSDNEETSGIPEDHGRRAPAVETKVGASRQSGEDGGLKDGNRGKVHHENQPQHQEIGTLSQPHRSLEALLHDDNHVDQHKTSLGSSIPKAHLSNHAEPTRAKQEPPKPVEQPKQSDTATKFQAYYLQRITTEFADDLDKLRQSEDFGIGHLEMLRRVLGQGVEAWDEGEMMRVVGSI